MVLRPARLNGRRNHNVMYSSFLHHSKMFQLCYSSTEGYFRSLALHENILTDLTVGELLSRQVKLSCNMITQISWHSKSEKAKATSNLTQSLISILSPLHHGFDRRRRLFWLRYECVIASWNSKWKNMLVITLCFTV